MAVLAQRSVTITFSGDVQGSEPYAAASNSNSPGQVQVVALTTGANTILAPTAGTTCTGVTIIPFAANTIALTLKGASGDTGVPIAVVGPTSLGIPTTTTSFIISAAAPANVRVIWN